MGLNKESGLVHEECMGVSVVKHREINVVKKNKVRKVKSMSQKEVMIHVKMVPVTCMCSS